ncbi:MAG: tetratricopeptide repeat protein [Pseudomonadota bacterium]|nr:tetratricopeptide repeat protein [Pseudomonadota bacterium]
MDDDDAKNVPEAHLASLAPRFLAAIQKRAAGQVDAALEAFNDILKVEPRIAEPRMEIARIYLEMGRLEDAEAEAREAIRILELGGQWTEDLPENVVLAVAWALYGEILKEKASSDEVVFGDPATFASLLEQSRAAFARAAALDPTDTTSAVTAMELGDGADSDDDEGEPEPDN